MWPCLNMARSHWDKNTAWTVGLVNYLYSIFKKNLIWIRFIFSLNATLRDVKVSRTGKLKHLYFLGPVSIFEVSFWKVNFDWFQNKTVKFIPVANTEINICSRRYRLSQSAVLHYPPGRGGTFPFCISFSRCLCHNKPAASKPPPPLTCCLRTSLLYDLDGLATAEHNQKKKRPFRRSDLCLCSPTSWTSRRAGCPSWMKVERWDPAVLAHLSSPVLFFSRRVIKCISCGIK